MLQHLADIVKKIIYDWGRGTLQRIEIVTEADLEKKPELPQSKMAKTHQRILDAMKKRHEQNRRAS